MFQPRGSVVNPGFPVLFLAYYYPPQKESGAERPRRFVRYLPDFGYSPVVITSADRYTVRVVRSGQPDMLPLSSSPGTRFAGLIADAAQRLLRERSERLPWAAQAVAVGADLIASNPGAAIVSTYPPFCTHLAAMRLHARYGTPWIADFRDPFADNTYARPWRLQKIYDPVLERRLFDRAGAVIANTDAVADLWRRRYPQHKNKIHLIWNGFDPAEDFRPIPVIPRQRQVLAHVGDIYGMRHPVVVLSSIERLLSAGRLDSGKLQVDLVGPVDPGSPMWASPAFQSLSARGMVSCNNQVLPREQAMRTIAEADYLLLLDLNPSTGNLQVPAKIFDYVRAGRPVLAATRENSGVDRILLQSGVPYTRIGPDESDAAVDRKVGEFLAQPPACHQPTGWFWEQFDGRRQTGTLASILDKIRAK